MKISLSVRRLLQGNTQIIASFITQCFFNFYPRTATSAGARRLMKQEKSVSVLPGLLTTGCF